jgi:hypothetical protein
VSEELRCCSKVAAYPTNVIAAEVRSLQHRVEQQGMGDYYARMTKEQEERENKEARESFMAQQERLAA